MTAFRANPGVLWITHGCCALFLNNHLLVSPGLFGATQNKGFGFGTSFGTGTGTGLGSGLGTGLGFGGFGTQQQQQQTSEYGLWIYLSLSSESAGLTPSVTWVVGQKCVVTGGCYT